VSSDADDLTRAYTAMVAEAQQMYAATQRATQQATALYSGWVDEKQLGSRLALTYRCAKGCTLLHVVRAPEPVDQERVIFGWPPYKTPKSVTEAQSTPAARATRTTDGFNHWQSRACYSEAVFEDFRVQCKHDVKPLSLERVRVDLQGDTPKTIVL